MTSVVVLSTPAEVVVNSTTLNMVANSTSVNVLVENEQTGVVDIITAGPQGAKGDKGDPGGTNIGGYDVVISNIGVGDILAFGGTTWFNNPQARLTDGGNF